MERMTKVRAKTVTLPEDKIGENLCDLRIDKDFFRSNARSTISKRKKLLIGFSSKLDTFAFQKTPLRKSNARGSEKMFAP